jgi:hypothetical protein
MNKDERRRAQQRLWRAANREHIKKYMKKYMKKYLSDPKVRARMNKRYDRYRANHPERYILSIASTTARKRGIRFNLKESDIIIPKRCPVFGLKLERKAKSRATTPTLDRINPRRGYVRGNVAVISHLANRLKNNATAAQHRRIADWMDTMTKQRRAR